MEDTSNSCEYHLTNITFMDAGTIEVNASNRYGHRTQKFRITVTGFYKSF